MKKNLIIILLIASFSFLGNIWAITDEQCQQHVDNGGRCGDLRDCSSVDGRCIANRSYAAEACIKSATTPQDCLKCDGTMWDWNLGECYIDTHASETSCWSYNSYKTCKGSTKFACVWVDKRTGEVLNSDVPATDAYCNSNNLRYIRCGDDGINDIPAELPPISSFIVNFLKIGTAVILIIISIVTLLKALASEKEEEITKARKSLTKKLIAAGMVFFVVSIVQFVILKFADSSETSSLSACLSCLLNNDCKEAYYYKTYIDDVCMEKDLETGEERYCNKKDEKSEENANTDNNTNGDSGSGSGSTHTPGGSNNKVQQELK